MKEMVYTGVRKSTLLEKDNYKGYDFYVLSLGSHPCCYIDIKDSLVNTDELDVHGGVTYEEDHLWDGEKHIEGNFVGWDYAHSGDKTYFGLFTPYCPGREYTTQELIHDCKDAIDQIVEGENE